jgi:hypothetical protein
MRGGLIDAEKRMFLHIIDSDERYFSLFIPPDYVTDSYIHLSG